MNNFDRMYQEVRRFAAEPDEGGPPPGVLVGMRPEVLVEMLMRIVDLEDRNAVKRIHDINKQVEEILRNVTGGVAGGA